MQSQEGQQSTDDGSLEIQAKENSSVMSHEQQQQSQPLQQGWVQQQQQLHGSQQQLSQEELWKQWLQLNQELLRQQFTHLQLNQLQGLQGPQAEQQWLEQLHQQWLQEQQPQQHQQRQQQQQQQQQVVATGKTVTISVQHEMKTVQDGTADAESKFKEYKQMGLEHEKKEEYAEALTCFSECIKICPSDTVGYTNRANILNRQKEYKRAEEDCNQALLLDGANWKALYNRALARQHLGKYRDALSDVESALKYQPGFQGLLNMRSKLASLAGKKHCQRPSEHNTRKSYAGEDDGVYVTFHVILPTTMWGWDDNSCLHIVLDDKSLAEKTEGLGNFSIVCIADGYYDMECKVYFKIGRCPRRYRKDLYYTYAVYSSNGIHNESLHWTSARNATMRLLHIEPSVKEYIKYDSMVLPPSDKTNSPNELYTRCLGFYLKRLEEKMLRSSIWSDRGIDEISMELRCIIESFSIVKVVNDYRVTAQKQVDIFPELNYWLKTFLDDLQKSSSHTKFISAIAVVNFLGNAEWQKNLDLIVVKNLLQMCLQCKLDRDHFDVLNKITSSESRLTTGNVLYWFIGLSVQTVDCFDLLRLLPIVHFLKGVPPTPPQWKDNDSILNDLRKKCEQKHNFMPECFETLKELFELDPKLLQDVVYVCPKESLGELLHHVDLSISSAWFLHVASRISNTQSEREDVALVLTCIAKAISVLCAMQTELVDLYKVCDMASSVLKNLLPKVPEVQFLRMFTEISLSAISKLDEMISGSMDSSKNNVKLNEIRDDLRRCVLIWLKEPKFAGGFRLRGDTLEEKEIALWSEMFRAGNAMHKPIGDQWKDMLQYCIQQIVMGKTLPMKVNLLHLLEKSSIDHEISEVQILDDISTNAVHQSFDKLLGAREKSSAGFDLVNKLLNIEHCNTKPHYNCVGRMIDYIFFKLFPEWDQIGAGTIDVPLDQILSSDLWSLLIRFNNSSCARAGLSPSCVKICNYAQQKLQQMFHDTMTGKVTRKDFSIIQKHLATIAKSLQAINASYGEFMKEKQKREIEFEQFETFSKQFHYLKEVLPHSSEIEGMLYIEMALQVDPEWEDHAYHEKVYALAGNMVQMVDMLHCISVTAKSEVFLHFWNANCAAASAKCPLKLSDICTAIWEPTVEQCLERLKKYTGFSITFRELKDDFNGNIDPSHIAKEVCNLNRGLELCKKIEGAQEEKKLMAKIKKAIETYQKLIQEYKFNAELYLESKPLSIVQQKLDDLIKRFKEKWRLIHCTTPQDSLSSEEHGGTKLTFHVIIPLEAWGWDDQSCMHIRFGQPHGSWKADCGTFQKRSSSGEFCEMVCTVPIYLNAEATRVEYKYVVYSSKIGCQDDAYEYLHYGAKSDVVYNRCLTINRNSIQNGHVQYDAFAWPSIDVLRSNARLQPDPGRMNRLFNYITGSSASSLSTTNPPADKTYWKPFGLQTDSKLSLYEYLKPHKDILLSCNFGDSFTIESFFHNVNHIYNSLQFQNIIHGDSHVIGLLKCESLPQELNHWVESIAMELGASTHSNRYLAAIAVIFCLYNLNQKISFGTISSLLSMIEMNKCNLECLLRACAGSKSIGDSIATLFSTVVTSCKTFEMKLLKSLPIIHFIKANSTVIGAIHPKDVKWGDDSLSLDILRKKLPSDLNISVQAEELHHLFKVDPLLLIVFIYITPKEAFPNLIQYTPIYLSICWLSHLIQQNWEETCNEMFSGLFKHIMDTLKDEKRILSSEESSFIAKSVTLLLEQSAFHINSINTLQLCISLTLLAESKIDEEKSPMASGLLPKLKLFTCNWISSPSVVGGSYFGGDFPMKWQGKKELEIWIKIFEAHQTSSNDINFDKFRQLISIAVNERIRNVPKKIPLIIQTLHLFDECNSQLCKSAQYDSLKDLICNGIMCAFDEIYKDKMDTIVAVLHNEEMHCKCIGKLMDHVFINSCPIRTHVGELSLQQLLEWNQWPFFIKEICTHSKAVEGFSPQCKHLCDAARNRWADICRQIIGGDCTKYDLDQIHTKHKLTLELTSAVEIDAKNVEQQIKQKLKIYEAFVSLCRQLEHLCTFLPETIDGFSTLKKQCCQVDQYKSFPINKLCTVFQYVGDVGYVGKQFWNLTKTQCSIVFALQWKAAIERNGHIAVSQIKSHLWDPTYESCRVLLQKFNTLEITFNEFCTYFKPNDEPNVTKSELSSFSKGMNDKISLDEVCINDICTCVELYNKIQRSHPAADLLLKIKDLLSLAGNFDNLEQIAKQVQVKQWTLKLLKEMAPAATFLENVTLDKEVYHCLQCLLDSRNILLWLKKETKDVSDLSNFVTVALATAAGGEDALTQDKLSGLRTIGTCFESLIYTLSQTAGCDELLRTCQSLVPTIKKHKNLRELLKASNNDLDWYKSVKETQGSVEVTSIGQMNNIQKYGWYTISSGDKPFQTIHDIIELKLEEQDKRLPKHKYTLDELRDLESKLVLITSNNSENRKEVDLFLKTLHSICSIAEVLLALQQAGYVDYIGWAMKCSCSRDHVSELQDQAQLMEQQLRQWEQHVNEARNKFYAMNYYTTTQLLYLQRELGALKYGNFAVPLSHQAFLLLQSTSYDTTATQIQEIIRNCLTNHSEELSATISENPTILSNLTNKANQQETEHPGSNAACAEGTAQITRNTALTARQKSLYDELVESYNFNPDLVFKGLKECEVQDIHELANWCTEHEDDVLTESQQAIIPVSEQIKDCTSHNEEKGAVADKEPITNHYLSNVITAIHQLYNERHPMVEKFVEAGFSFEDSIRAVKISDANEDAALSYLLSLSDSGSLFNDAIPPFQTSEPAVSNTSGFQQSLEFLPDLRIKSKYLNIEELGKVLKAFSEHNSCHGHRQRVFPVNVFKTGCPNLVVTEPFDVLATVLSLYMQDSSLPLPTMEEVLICSKFTTDEDVTLLWRRAVGDPKFTRIFCLVHAERLTYQVSDKVLQTLNRLTQSQSEYRLVIICSNEDEQRSHILSKLHMFKRQFATQNVTKCAEYLRNHFNTVKHDSAAGMQDVTSVSDIERSNVCVVTSYRSGMGKSLYIKRMVQNLKHKQQCPDDYQENLVSIPLHGPLVTSDTVMEFLKGHLSELYSTFHFDIAHDVIWQMDSILFSLTVLKSITDSHGQLWRCHNTNRLAVEVTIPSCKGDSKQATLMQCTLHLLEMLPSVKCVGPKESISLALAPSMDTSKVSIDEKKIAGKACSTVYKYLSQSSSGHMVSGNNSSDMVKTLLLHCGIENPSWAELRHFVKFLSVQLQSCEKSVFCDESIVGEVLKGFKSFVVKFMIRMSRDFSTPSLCGEVSGDEKAAPNSTDTLENYQIEKRRQWEQSYHPYLFFNEDRITITFIGFLVSPNGDLVDPATKQIIEGGIMTPQLYTGLKSNNVHFDDDCRTWTNNKEKMILKLARVMGLEAKVDPDPSYVLTVDNLIKILAILMRFRCGIPVVIMGETGCGKTRLIRYMCNLASISAGRRNMLTLKVHGGTTEKQIEDVVIQAQKLAEGNKAHNLDTVVFFDEANTTEAIGLIKEIMCDRRLKGRFIDPAVKFIAACNPYRKHSEEMIRKLESAGLGFYIQATEVQQKLGKIPLRHLVYRVVDIPQSMRHLVYDFGQLNVGTEDDYIEQIVHNHISNHSQLKEKKELVNALTKVLKASQKYMRTKEDECSYVSLRDVERAMIIFHFFYDKHHLFKHDTSKPAGEDKIDVSINAITQSVVLSLSICYHAKLQSRSEYEETISKEFSQPLCLPGGAVQFRNEIQRCQEMMLDHMILRNNVARNAALRENVFMMAICIELRIPLFLVGKPGSSKSLAKSIIADSMHGRASQNDFMKHFKQVQMFSYQCSQHSTSESVIEVFNTAKRFQNSQDHTQFVSVVVLDEVGLAEDSPNLPLKALHPLLEDGTEGADKILSREERVAFIGISNWALDPAKMNRGVMVTRGNPNTDELESSARGICSNTPSDPVLQKLQPLLRPLCEAYQAVCPERKRDFFGLRDFYSLIKMLYWMCQNNNETGLSLTWQQMQHAVRRNFGGEEEFDPLFEFLKRTILMLPDAADLSSVSNTNPDCTTLGLIRTSLMNKEKTWHGENRYLLFLTENYAALQILHHYLTDTLKSVSINSKAETEMILEPFVLFGSSFPKDKEYTQVCRNINQIKICMETGRSVILLNLENLYESLYDVLNQYYIVHGENRYVDLGLQTHRVKCRVHENFKLIMIAEKETVYNKFPTPLINRLEKHFVLASSVLTEVQKDVLLSLEKWVQKFSTAKDCNRHRSFCEAEAFIGYQRDTAAAVVFQATTSHIKEINHVEKDMDKNVILKKSKHLLLQTASPDAVIRLEAVSPADFKDLEYDYTTHQYYDCLSEFLRLHITGSVGTGAMMQVTTHGHLLSSSEVDQITKELRTSDGYQITTSNFYLHDFDTELAFSNKIGASFKQRDGAQDESLLVLQCEFGHLDGDLIACARYRIIDEKKATEKEKNVDKCRKCHVLLIIHLPRKAIGSSFVGFQSNPWVSAHIDELRNSEDDTINPFMANGKNISSLFGSAYFQPCHSETEMLQPSQHHSTLPPLNLCKCLHRCIQPAVCKSTSVKQSKRGYNLVQILVELIPKDFPTSDIDDSTFHGILAKHTYSLLQQRDHAIPSSEKWVLQEACNRSALQHGGTFRNALVRKLDDVVVSLFSGIITFIDQFSNLDLIHKHISSTSSVAEFWLAVFKAPDVIAFKYGAPINMSTHFKEFECKLPFFWIIKDAFDTQLDIAEGILQAEGAMSALCDQICSLVASTPIGGIIKAFPYDDHSLYTYYVHDFLKCVHHCSYRNSKYTDQEYKLISGALDTLISTFCADQRTLMRKMAALHIVYSTYKQHITWFGHLMSCFPSLLTDLELSEPNSKECMVLHLDAVQNAMKYLEPPLEEKEDKYLCNWLYLMQKCQIVIDTILSLNHHGQESSNLFLSITRQWHRLCVMQLFVEHLVTKFKDMMPFAKRLNLAMKDNKPDIFSDTIIKKIKAMLNSMVSQLEKVKYEDVQNVRVSCFAFFMQLITHVCFEYGTPKEDLILHLISMVFNEKEGSQDISTRQISPYKEETQDSTPIVRSSLLQLLLDNSASSSILQNHIHDYFAKAQRVLSAEKIHDLYLMFVQCYEHTCSKIYESSQHISFIEDGFSGLVHHSPSERRGITLEYLNAVAQVRFGLHLSAKCLVQGIEEPVGILREENSIMDSCSQLLMITERICRDTTINQIDQVRASGPLMYLLRLLVRKYGMMPLTKICKKYQWVQPPNLECKIEGEGISDEFVIYGDEYNQFQEQVSKIIYGGMVQQLSLAPKHTPSEVAFSVLAICNVSITGKARNYPFPSDAIKALQQTLQTFRIQFPELHDLGQEMLNQPQFLVDLSDSHEARNILAIVVHSAVVFFAKSKVLQLLEPFLVMLRDPASLVDMYLPTMPDDPLYCDSIDLDDSYSDYYICSNKHKFFPNECGKTNVIECPKCQSQNYQQMLRQKNKQADAGYTLGKPKDRNPTETAIRKLTSPACCILRALMHAAYVWCSYHHENTGSGLMKDEHTSAEFFCQHLKKDIDNLSVVTGKSIDDSIRLVHIVLHDILTSDQTQDTQFQFRLTSVQMRNHWEDLFTKTYLQPVLKSIDQRVDGAVQSILQRAKHAKAQDRFIYAIYEQAENMEDSFLWMYYPQITLQHLHQTLQTLQTSQTLQSQKQICPILHKFLCQEQYIRATWCIPDISKLQQVLCKRTHHRLDQQQAARISFAQFVDKSEFSEFMRNALKEWFTKLQSAWNICRNMLPDYAKDKDRKYFCSSLSEDTALEYFIPTTTGAGVCTHFLMRFLVDTHNELLTECDRQLAQKERRATVWRRSDYSIQVENIQSCHLMNYKSKIQSVLTAHCHYSIGEQGQGINIHYDYIALEKHLVDRVIHGRPYIKYEIPHVVYQKEIYTTEHFMAIQKKVKPQEKLPLQLQREIMNELHTIDKLKSALDTVEMVMGFLASGGSSASESLAVYTDEVLKLDTNAFATKNRCKLSHILSIWETISVELAKKMTLHDENPFRTPEQFLQSFSVALDDTQKLELDKMLRRVQLQWMLGVIYQLITLYLKDDKEKDSQLLEVLKVFLDVNEIEVPPQLSEFPQSIKVTQVMATWKHIVFYQEKNM